MKKRTGVHLSYAANLSRVWGPPLFIHFPEGMGRSKLKPPFQKIGTGRNLNTTD